MIVLLEGIRGTGKQTLAEKFCESGRFVRCDLPVSCIDISHTCAKDPQNLQRLYGFYVRCVRDQYEELAITRALNPGKGIIVVRSWPAVMAYFRTLGVQVSKQDFKTALEPDAIVHLMADNPTRLKGRWIKKCVERVSEPFQALDAAEQLKADMAYERIYALHATCPVIPYSQGNRTPEESMRDIKRALTALAIAA